MASRGGVGKKITTFNKLGKEYPIVVQQYLSDRRNKEGVSKIFVRSETNGKLISLSNLVSFKEEGSAKQLARIYLQEDEKEKAIKIFSDTYDNLVNKEIYVTFDYAEFLKNNEKFEKSIVFYTEIIKKLKKNHPLYAEATDGRGIAFERRGEWDKAEKEL